MLLILPHALYEKQAKSDLQKWFSVPSTTVQLLKEKTNQNGKGYDFMVQRCAK